MPNRVLPSNDVLKALYESGLGQGEIAEKLGANVNTVAAALKRVPGLVMRSCKEAKQLSVAHGRFKPMKFWLGKKQPRDFVERRVSKIRGSNHYLWKGGKERRTYRDVVERRECAKCGSRLNLGIHHVNFDHYDNNPANLQVLCVSCHLSLHKTEYWKAKREGRTPPKSTAPHHWRKKNGT